MLILTLRLDNANGPEHDADLGTLTIANKGGDARGWARTYEAKLDIVRNRASEYHAVATLEHKRTDDKGVAGALDAWLLVAEALATLNGETLSPARPGARRRRMMVKHAELGAVVEYGKKLYRIVGIGDGKTYILDPVIKDRCEHCGRETEQVHMIEASLNFQNDVLAVKTVSE